ncbi:hypothetical protein GS397_07135 [Sphingobium yanoikuyae]|uniref:Uncharacterized protein n=1 Tax=Sphingobium yanoikuyae TaxID=13690 RepID=A0A6P1GF30_SPHYA|nr:hypothetical protein [Sphingobium yanoikuyae]QHD66844.1 hypothetical protein GS397_07135 [Sphingobium yanoikuyae]
MIEISERSCRGVRLPCGYSRTWIIENCSRKAAFILLHNVNSEVLFSGNVKSEWWHDDCWNNLVDAANAFEERTGLDYYDLEAKMLFENPTDAIRFKLTFGGL